MCILVCPKVLWPCCNHFSLRCAFESNYYMDLWMDPNCPFNIFCHHFIPSDSIQMCIWKISFSGSWEEKDSKILRKSSALSCVRASNTPLLVSHSSFDGLFNMGFDRIRTRYWGTHLRSLYSDICVDTITLANESTLAYQFHCRW